MKAIKYTTYGSPDVLKLQEVEKPVPGAHEVLIKVHAASVNAGDWHLLRGEPFPVRLMYGLLKPKYRILGTDVAGQVAAAGKKVRMFKPGDEVFGDLSGCGFGAFAEYVCANENAIALKPKGITFEQAAAVPSAAVTALQGLSAKGQIQPGQKVLINGASGGVGTFAVQIAKAFGAEVTAVCSTRKMDMVSSIGADHVIDYTKDNFTRNGKQYDFILAANGYHPIADYRRALSPRGTYMMTGGSNAQMFQAMLMGPLLSVKGEKKMGNLLVKPCRKDLLFMNGLLEAGRIKPLLDRTYSLKEVPDAIRYLEEGHANGKVVIRIPG